jgi:DNA-binding MarR family transcriptional regulator
MSARSEALLEHGSGALVAATARAVAGLYRPLLQPLGLTHPQYLVLLALDVEDPQSCTQLGEKLYLTPGTMSPLLKRLERLGYVHRHRNPASERELEISLTPSGRELLPALWDIGADVTHAVTTADPGHAQLHTLLRSILTAASPTA